MKLLVTGGAGYVGSVCAAVLVEQGHEVVIVDDLSTGNADAVPDGAQFVDDSRIDVGPVDHRRGVVGVHGAWPARSRSRISCHSPIARKARTATTAIPPAVTIAPVSRPNPLATPHSPVHCTAMTAWPSTAPSRPPASTAMNAMVRAVCGGMAERGRDPGTSGDAMGQR